MPRFVRSQRAGWLAIGILLITLVAPAPAADFKFQAGTPLAQVFGIIATLGRFKVTCEGELGSTTSEIDIRQVDPVDAMRKIAADYNLTVEESGTDPDRSYTVRRSTSAQPSPGTPASPEPPPSAQPPPPPLEPPSAPAPTPSPDTLSE